jgi:hypothetical protein
MAGLTNYHTDQVTLSWNNINITGYASDTFIEVERDEDGFTSYVGSLGDVCRTRNLNRMGKITVTLMASAPVNDQLAAAAQLDEDSGLDYGPIQVKDLNGTMRADGAEAWIMKRPKIDRAKESGTVQWVFSVAYLNMYEGGNVV